MERHRLSADQAFERLREASMNLNVKLHDIAEGLVTTGQEPWTKADTANRYVPPPR